MFEKMLPHTHTHTHTHTRVKAAYVPVRNVNMILNMPKRADTFIQVRSHIKHHKDRNYE